MIDEESRAWKQGFVDIVDWLQGMYNTPDDNGKISKDLNDKIPVTSIRSNGAWVEKIAHKIEFTMGHDLEYAHGASYFTVKVDNATFKFESSIWDCYREHSVEYGRYITVVYPQWPHKSQVYYYKEDADSEV